MMFVAVYIFPFAQSCSQLKTDPSWSYIIRTTNGIIEQPLDFFVEKWTVMVIIGSAAQLRYHFHRLSTQTNSPHLIHDRSHSTRHCHGSTSPTVYWQCTIMDAVHLMYSHVYPVCIPNVMKVQKWMSSNQLNLGRCRVQLKIDEKLIKLRFHDWNQLAVCYLSVLLFMALVRHNFPGITEIHFLQVCQSSVTVSPSFVFNCATWVIAKMQMNIWESIHLVLCQVHWEAIIELYSLRRDSSAVLLHFKLSSSYFLLYWTVFVE